MQKFPAPDFSVTTNIEFNAKSTGEKTGLIIFGLDYSYIGLEKTDRGYRISLVICKNADKGEEENIINTADINTNKIFFRVSVKQTPEGKALCKFSYSEDGKIYSAFGNEFIAKPGRWVGTKVGVFSLTLSGVNQTGYTDFDWFRFSE